MDMNARFSHMEKALPSGVSTMMLTPTTASEKKDTLTSLLTGLRLNPVPVLDAGIYDDDFPQDGPKWTFKWPADAHRSRDELRALEKSSYPHVVHFLKDLGIAAFDMGNGEDCVSTVLFRKDIYTLRQLDPFVHRGQVVTMIHTVSGRTDIVILSRDFFLEGHTRIAIWMTTVLIEIKTVAGMSGSGSNCRREAIVQLIGANAANTTHAPPVVVSNLARTHFVLYLDRLPLDKHPYEFVIRERTCKTFPSALHFALSLVKRGAIAQDFARAPTPPVSDADFE